MEPASLPAQHMRTKQPGLAIIDCRYWLLAGGRISLAYDLPIGRLWSHTFSAYGAPSEVSLVRSRLPMFM
jgi:hypothetical protein